MIRREEGRRIKCYIVDEVDGMVMRPSECLDAKGECMCKYLSSRVCAQNKAYSERAIQDMPGNVQSSANQCHFDGITSRRPRMGRPSTIGARGSSLIFPGGRSRTWRCMAQVVCDNTPGWGHGFVTVMH